MSEKMTPIPFGRLLEHVFSEHETHGSVFGIEALYAAKKPAELPLFRERLEMPFGPAAGPNTQLAENIIAAYCAGARFFELKTVQRMDGAELAACINRPCILADDEGYNCEWSTELTVPEAMEEYIKAWFILKLISRKWALGDPEGFIFNMSVGYDLDGIKTEKLNRFIDGMIDASDTGVWRECVRLALEKFPEDSDYILSISPRVCTGVTVSTLHGCPPGEIEAIASYLISEKKLNTFVKCNPTILGYDFARARLDRLGYDYISFDRHHFEEDLQFADAVPMFRRLGELAGMHGVEFGLKLSNTFPVEVKANELPSEEMYMSGRALYPLTVEMARRMAEAFSGQIRISFSGGADYFNMKPLFDAGIWPITVATTVLKPGGYARFTELAELFEGAEYKPFCGVDTAAVAALSASSEADPRHTKAIKPLPSRKNGRKVPLFSCFTAPCAGGCPISQDIPEYIELAGKGLYLEALELITEKNPLPFITGTICAHRCMDRCTRNFYDESVHIRSVKLLCAEKAYDELMEKLAPPVMKAAPKTAVIGGGPAGLAAAYFLAREGYPVTVFEKESRLGGTVANCIPDFRIGDDAIEKDIALVRRMGAEFVLGAPAPSLAALEAAGYERILLAAGAGERGAVGIDGAMNAIDFLESIKRGELKPEGRAAAVIGGGNSAMDAARAARRLGYEKVSIVYRRTRRYMPADAEELSLAMDEGIEFCELLAPLRREGTRLLCSVMKLGEADSSGRRSPVDTGETAYVDADAVIAAVGEKPSSALLAAYGVKTDARGRGIFPSGRVYGAGDVLRGPATVVEAIADARAFADAVTGARELSLPAASKRAYRAELMKKGVLAAPSGEEWKRCLGCGTVCESCVSVCPNRANVAVKVEGHAMREVVHLDALCNECGNCAVFCPYESRPFRDKFTLYASEADLLEGENDGFFVKAPGSALVRIDGQAESMDIAAATGDAAEVIRAIMKDYPYLVF